VTIFHSTFLGSARSYEEVHVLQTSCEEAAVQLTAEDVQYDVVVTVFVDV
jgi:isocitrate/isopropylmalate dehydrogenase